MIRASQNGRHSATVQMTLIVGGRELEVAQSTPTHLILREAVPLPGSHAQLLLSIDGVETRRSIEILDGRTSSRVSYR